MNVDISHITLLKCENIFGVTDAINLFNGGYIAECGGKYENAVKSYCFAAEAKIPQAQNNLGRMYAYGWGVEQDFVLAYMWFHLAAVQELYEANENCKTMTAEKLVSKEDIDKAIIKAEEYR